MTKWMKKQSKAQRLEFAKSDLQCIIDKRGRYNWYIINRGMGNTRISAARAQEKLIKSYGLTLEDFING